MYTGEEMQKEIESIEFYGCGDEAYECWCRLIGVCFDFMCYGGPGKHEKAEIVLGWIKEQAQWSKDWCQENYYFLADKFEDVERRKGVFCSDGGLREYQEQILKGAYQ